MALDFVFGFLLNVIKEVREIISVLCAVTHKKLDRNSSGRATLREMLQFDQETSSGLLGKKAC